MFKTIMNQCFSEFCRELAEAMQDGWEIAPDSTGSTGVFGNLFSIEVLRNDDTVAKFKANAEAMSGKPKLTKEEQAARAREAKARLRLEREALNEPQLVTLNTSTIIE